MKKKALGVLSAVALGAAGLVGAALPAQAQTEWNVDVGPAPGTAFSDGYTFDWAVTVAGADPLCDSPDVYLNGSPQSDAEADEFVSVDAGGYMGTVNLRTIAPGSNQITLECEEVVYNLNIAHSTVTVAKQVEGEVPDGTSFAFRAVLDGDESTAYNWDMGASDTQTLWFFGGESLDVEETDNGGAESTVEDNTSIALAGSQGYQASFTNVFAGEQPVDSQDPDLADGDDDGDDDGDNSGDDDGNETDESSKSKKGHTPAKAVTLYPVYTG